MDNSPTPPIVAQSPQSIPPDSNKNVSKSHHIIFGFAGLLVLLIGMGAIYTWQHHKVTQLNSQLNNYQATLVKDSKISLNNLNASKAANSSNSTSHDTLSSPMPQSQFSNPAFTATLNYLSCLSNAGGSSKIVSSTICKSGNQTYTAPTTFTYAMITNYSWLPASADSTFISASQQQFQFCSSSQGSGIGGANEVNYSNADFVIFTYGMCGDSKTGLYQDKNGTWSHIASAGVGGPLPNCSPYSTDNIPMNVLKDNGICSD